MGYPRHKLIHRLHVTVYIFQDLNALAVASIDLFNNDKEKKTEPSETSIA
jgi:hypothetical protein